MEPILSKFVFAAISCLLMGRGVWCDCPATQVGIEGGNYTLTKELSFSSLLLYHCPLNYYPSPEMFRTCQWDNTWSPAFSKRKPQSCRLVECPDPTHLPSGMVLPPQDRYFVGNVTTYECYSGYPLRGSSKRTCLPNGKWSGSTPICSRTSGHICADPGVPPGATRSGTSFLTNSKVTYACNEGLLLIGSSERVCLENGQWTGSEPECYSKFAYDTSLEVTLAFGKSIINTLTTLEPDETQQGRTIRISKDETLNIFIGIDISGSINEEQFENATKAVLSLIRKISSFTVTPNYDINFFSSDLHNAVNILDFYDGKIQLNTVEEKIKSFKIKEKGFGTNLNNVFKKISEKMGYIKITVGDEVFKEQRHVIIIFTDGAFNMGGSPAPTIERIKNMVYMNHSRSENAPSREEYLDIYIFAIGTNIIDRTLQPLTVGLGKKHYYKLPTGVKLEEMFDDIIDESQVMELCGLHRRYESTTADSKRRMYPWVAFIYIQNKGQTRKCLGSLVSSKFILTSAHCFQYDDLPNHVTVEIDDGDNKIKEVKDFYLHPDYKVDARVGDGVPEFYDYDVALIQLTDYVKISPAVRSICIPCTQETNDALKLVDGTCKKQEELVLNNDIERLSFLTRTENLVDPKDVHAKLQDKRPDCIKHALTAKGMTTKQPEMAVTENFLCTGGLDHYRDHIACKGDSGGAVFKNVEERTIQVAVVSWGTQEVCDGGGLFESKENSRDFHINLFKVVPFLRKILGDKNQVDYEPLTFLPDE